MPPLYVSPFKKNNPKDESDQSNCVVSSDACEITFAKNKNEFDRKHNFIELPMSHS